MVTFPCLVLVGIDDGSIHRATKHASMWQIGGTLSIVFLLGDLTLRELHRNPKLFNLLTMPLKLFVYVYIYEVCLLI